MNVIVEYNLQRLEVDGKFEICGSREDLQKIVESIEKELASFVGEDGHLHTMSYGWVKISE